ncbi:MAG TPA: hypothetical protein VJB98_02965 [Candidatus Paceibacterota bacterium]
MNKDEKKFIKLFSPLRAIKPREVLLTRVLETAGAPVTDSSNSRLYNKKIGWWSLGYARIMIGSFAVLLLVVGVLVARGGVLNPSKEIVALDMDSAAISDMISRLEVSQSYEAEIISQE